MDDIDVAYTNLSSEARRAGRFTRMFFAAGSLGWNIGTRDMCVGTSFCATTVDLRLIIHYAYVSLLSHMFYWDSECIIQRPCFLCRSSRFHICPQLGLSHEQTETMPEGEHWSSSSWLSVLTDVFGGGSSKEAEAATTPENKVPPPSHHPHPPQDDEHDHPPAARPPQQEHSTINSNAVGISAPSSHHAAKHRFELCGFMPSPVSSIFHIHAGVRHQLFEKVPRNEHPAPGSINTKVVYGTTFEEFRTEIGKHFGISSPVELAAISFSLGYHSKRYQTTEQATGFCSHQTSVAVREVTLSNSLTARMFLTEEARTALNSLPLDQSAQLFHTYGLFYLTRCTYGGLLVMNTVTNCDTALKGKELGGALEAGWKGMFG